MTKSTQRRLAIFLASAGLALSYTVFEQVTALPLTPEVTTATKRAEPRRTAVPSDAASELPGLEFLRETLDRPLFLASRRALSPRSAPTQEPDVDRRQYQLVGIVLFDNRRIALIKPFDREQVLRVTEGQRFDRWRVAKIEARQVVLSQGDLTQALQLVDATRPAPKQRPTVDRASPQETDQNRAVAPEEATDGQAKGRELEPGS